MAEKNIEYDIYRAYNVGASKKVYLEEDFANKVKVALSKDYSFDISRHTHVQEKDGSFRRDYEANKLTLEDVRNGNPIEVYVDNKGKIIKTVVRVSNMSEEFDWCVVVLIDDTNKNFKVKTIWLNSKDDNHCTLSKNYCVRPLKTKCSACKQKGCLYRSNIIR